MSRIIGVGQSANGPLMYKVCTRKTVNQEVYRHIGIDAKNHASQLKIDLRMNVVCFKYLKSTLFKDFEQRF